VNNSLNVHSGSTVPFIVGLGEYLANTIPIISSYLGLLFKRFSKNIFITKSADVLPIWQRNGVVRSPINSHQYTFNNSTIPNKEPIVSNSLLIEYHKNVKNFHSKTLICNIL